MSFTLDTVSTRLGELGKTLPGTAHPRVLFRPWRRSGALLNLSGQVNERDGAIVQQGIVGAVPGFADAPLVINAASELLISLYGAERGAHARTAIAVAGLPGRAPVEIDAMLEMMP